MDMIEKAARAIVEEYGKHAAKVMPYHYEPFDALPETGKENARACARAAIGTAIGWQPIETVPKDTFVYVWMPRWHGRGPLVYTMWRGGYWVNDMMNGGWDDNFKPTHWMPVPDPPEGTKSPTPIKEPT